MCVCVESCKTVKERQGGLKAETMIDRRDIKGREREEKACSVWFSEHCMREGTLSLSPPGHKVRKMNGREKERERNWKSELNLKERANSTYVILH